MTDIDLSAQFDKISDKAKSASDKLKAAGQGTRDRLETDVVDARDRASAAADRLNDKASSQWQEVRAKWQAHVAKVKSNVRDTHDRIDADLAANDGDLAEGYAIDFAQATIDEAESAVLDAMYARANAVALDAEAR